MGISRTKVNNVYETNPDKISNKFNIDFSTIAQNLNSKIKSKESCNLFLDYPSQETFFISPPVEAEIEKLTFLLDSKKSNSLHRFLLTCSNVWPNMIIQF